MTNVDKELSLIQISKEITELLKEFRIAVNRKDKQEAGRVSTKIACKAKILFAEITLWDMVNRED